MTLRIAPAFLALALLLLANSCDVLSKNVATKGPQLYKAQTAALAGEMTDQLASNGKLSDVTKKKFDSLITKWEPEFPQSNSMRNLKEAQVELNAMVTDPNNAFQHKESASFNILEALRNLETEVRSDS
ncbi:MAG: hypothetical protein M3R04_01725 [bacterium]|nr:hypothetical protein [bacterium]